MKIISESCTQKVSPKTGEFVLSETGKYCYTTTSGKEIWAPKSVKSDRVITYKLNEIGDFFIAYANSESVDDEGMPIYSKGDKVTREKESWDFIGFQHEMPLPPADNSTLEDKFALMAKYGISPKL